jgi:hypothetical protein
MVPFMLQNSQGKQWEVYCISNTKGNSSMRITSGFSKFARENNLLEGVTYVFELIKRKPVVVLQVAAICTVKKSFTFVYSSILISFTVFSFNV